MIPNLHYTVKIKDLLVSAIHGVFEEEQHQAQPFLVSADITYLPSGGSNSHHAEGEGNYLCYAELCDFIKKTIKSAKVGLLETLCELLAKSLFAQYSSIEAVRVAISKPEAIMEHEFAGSTNKQVSVEASFPRERQVVLSLGSNIEDRFAYLQEAIRLLNIEDGVDIRHSSGVYETVPWGGLKHQEEQPRFLNCCVSGLITLSPMKFLRLCQKIEARLGRIRSNSSIKWQNRTIDIDIILMDNVEIRSNTLTVPHKHMLERAFVLLPLAELYVEQKLSLDDKGAIKASQKIDTKGVHLRKDLKLDV